MLFWKLFVAADLLIFGAYGYAIGTGKERLRRSDFVTIPVGLIGLMGLIIYAFSLPKFATLAWRIFLPIFVASAAWEIADAANKPHFDVGRAIGVAMATVIAGFTSIALYRLGGSLWIGVDGL